MAAGAAKGAYQIVQALNKAVGSGGSKTLNRTAKTVEGSESNGGADPEISYSSWYKLLKGPKSAKGRPFPTNTTLDYNSKVTQGGPGRLHVGTLNTGNVFYLREFAQKLYTQNESMFQSKVGPTGTVPTVENSPLEIYHISTEVLVDFTNFSNAGVHLDIYEMHPKKNCPDAPTVPWHRGLIDSHGHDAAVGTEAPISEFVYPVGTKPTDSEELKGLWDIDLHRRFYLGPGDTHRHRSLYAPHKLLKNSAISTLGDNSFDIFIRGHSRIIMWTLSGTPTKLPIVGDLVVGPNASELHYVTTAAVDVGVMHTVKYKYSMCEFNPAGDIDVIGSLWSTDAGKIREADGDEMPVDNINS